MGVIVLQGSCPWGYCPQGSCPRGSCPRGSCPRTNEMYLDDYEGRTRLYDGPVLKYPSKIMKPSKRVSYSEDLTSGISYHQQIEIFLRLMASKVC